jgi:hypothetical protein
MNFDSWFCIIGSSLEEFMVEVHHGRFFVGSVMRTSLIWMHTTLLRWTFKVQSLELVHDN